MFTHFKKTFISTCHLVIFCGVLSLTSTVMTYAEVRETRNKAEEIVGYVTKAKQAFRDKDLDAARSYAQKAYELLGDGELGREMAALIAIIDKKTGENKIRGKAEEVAGNIVKARQAFSRGDLDNARKHARRAYVMLDSPEMKWEIEKFLAQVERTEMELEMRKKAEKVAAYVTKSRKYLNKGDFDNARVYADKAIELSGQEIKVQEEKKIEDRKKKLKEQKRLEREEKNRLRVQRKAEKKEKEKEKREKRQEAKDKKRAEKIEKCIRRAKEQLGKNEFDKARSFISVVFGIEKGNQNAQKLLGEINRAEESYKKKKERIREEEETRFKLQEEKYRKIQEEAAEKKLEETIKRYLKNARKELNKNKFGKARNYAKIALKLKEGNNEALEILSETDQSEGVYEEERRLAKEKQDHAKQEEKARIRARKEAKIRSEMEVLAKKKVEKIVNYLGKAKKTLQENKFDKARRYVKKVLRLEEDNSEAQELEIRIEQAGIVYKERQKTRVTSHEPRATGQEASPSVEGEELGDKKDIGKPETVDEEIKKAEKVAKKQLRIEAREAKEKEKAERYISKSRKYLSGADYENARYYAYKAREKDPENTNTISLITDIDEEEMFGKREEELRIDKKLKKAFKELETKDPFYDYDEGKTWMEMIAQIYERKEYSADGVQTGKIYNVDECVQIAKRNNQRVIVADKQVKLAKMRVWETRRGLFPTVTGRIERSTGKISTGTGLRHWHGEKYQVEIKQNLFDGMSTWFDLRQSQVNLEIIKLEREKIKNEIIESTRRAYYNLDKSIKSLGIQKILKTKVNDFYNIAEGAYQQELIARVEHLKVKGQNMQADFQYESSAEDVKLAKMILFQEMNMTPDQDIEIVPVDPPGEPLSIGLENCYRLAMANRPEFQIKEKMIEYYEYERKMKKSVGWPKFDFQGSFGKSYEAYQPTEDTDEERSLGPEWFAGIKASFPIWGNTAEYNYVREKWAPTVSSFRGSESATSYISIGLFDNIAYFTGLQEARVGFESAKQEYQKAGKDLAIEVKEIYFKYRKSLLQMDVAKAQVEHQRMFMDVLEERRRFGEMDLSKIIEEYEKLAEYEYGSIQGSASYFISLAELNRSVGISNYFRARGENKRFEDWKDKKAEVKAEKEYLAVQEKQKHFR